MVVATDRYVAEDAAERIVVDYAPLPAVVGLDAARAADRLVHDDVPGNIAARMTQQHPDPDGRDAPAAIAAAPHRLDPRADHRALGVHAARGPRRARALGRRRPPTPGLVLDADLDRRARRGGGEARPRPVRGRGDHPGRRRGVRRQDRAPVAGGGARPVRRPGAGPAGEVRRGPPGALHRRRARAGPAAARRGRLRRRRAAARDWTCGSGTTTAPTSRTASSCRSSPRPSCSARTSRRAYRVTFDSLYTNTVIVTPYRGAGRPQGVYAMERTMDAIARYLGRDRTEVRAANFIRPDEMPYDHGLIFQDGRPLIYDSGDYPALLDKLKKLVGWDDFEALRAAAAAEGRRIGIGLACYVEGTGVGPYEGGHVQVETTGKVKVATGLTSQGQGHQTVFAQIVADELGVPLADVEVVTGDTRRFPYAVGTFASRAAVMSGSAIALAARAAQAEDPPGRRRGARGEPGRPRAGRRRGPGTRRARSVDRPGHRRGAVQPTALRLRRGVQGGHPVRGRRPRRRPRPGGRRAGHRGPRLLLTDPLHLRHRHARRRRRDRPGHRRGAHPAVLRGARLRHADQPAHRRGPDPRRCRAGRRRRAVRADGLRRARPAAERVVHGLPDAVRHRGPGRHRDRPPRDAVAAEPAGDQGRRGGGGHPVGGGVRVGHRGRRGHRPSRPCPSRRASCSSCDSSGRGPGEGHRRCGAARPGRRRVGGAQRPGRAGPHHPRMRELGRDRTGCVPDGRAGRRGVDQAARTRERSG